MKVLLRGLLYMCLMAPMVIVSFSTNCYAVDWKHYALDVSDNVYLYDEESIVNLTGDTIQVWTKCVYSEKHKESLRSMEWPELSKAQAEGFAKLKRESYVVDLSEINCATRTIQSLMKRQYDDNGSLLDTLDKETLSKFVKLTGEGPYITPGSIDEMLYSAVCKKVSKPIQKTEKSPLKNKKRGE